MSSPSPLVHFNATDLVLTSTHKDSMSRLPSPPRKKPIRVIRIALLGAGLYAGVTITRSLHARSDDETMWAGRLANTTFRYADIPVGGLIGLATAPLLPRRTRPYARALAWGALVGAVGVGLSDPLPPLDEFDDVDDFPY